MNTTNILDKNIATTDSFKYYSNNIKQVIDICYLHSEY